MRAFSLIFNRVGSPIKEMPFHDSLRRLDPWGRDCCESWVGDGIAIGHQHNWITPEEQGERQPISDDRSTAAFVGRIDNRDELIAALGLDRLDGAALSDAALVLRCFRE